MSEVPATADPIARQRSSRMPIHRYQPYQQQFPIDLPDRQWPARQITRRAPLVRGRPARRQPGPDRPDVGRAQAAHVQPAGADGLQGDRGRLPGGQPDRLRLRPAAHRAGPDPGRRHHPGADPVPGASDRAHLRVAARRQAGHRALLQLDLDAAAAGRVRPGPGRHHRHRDQRRPAVPEVRQEIPRRTPRSSTSTRRSPTPAPSWTTRWRSAPRSSTSSSRRRTGR